MTATRLGLGTAQFGLDYGISNRRGRTPPEEVGAILGLAAARGIKVIDTAPSYHDAETLLGDLLPHPNDFAVVTKTPLFDRAGIGDRDIDDLRRCFETSLGRLGCGSVYGLLVHHATDLCLPGGNRLARALADLKRQGLVARIGVSVHAPDEIGPILECFEPDIVQAPFNVFDQRLVRDGHADRLTALGCEIHVRSAFLQGLLLMKPDDLPPHLDAARQPIREFRAAAEGAGLSRPAAALQFVRRNVAASAVIVGVTTAAELADVADAFEAADADLDFARFATADSQIIDPLSWLAAS